MKNIIATVPRSKFKSLALFERVAKRCTGDRNFWLINCASLPTQLGPDSVCFMVFDGKVRGYFHIVDTDKSENWRSRHGIGKARTTQCIVMATWHPYDGPAMTGFQGYRYTELQP